MNDIIYFKIADNNNTDNTESMYLRTKNSNIFINVLKLLDKKNDFDNYLQFLNHCYYNWLPDYFFTTPASSTGKYHPVFANSENGLMLHSLAVTRIAHQLFDILNESDDKFSGKTLNNLICAAWLHDMFKYGDPFAYKPGTLTDHGHPKYAADFFKNSDVIAKCKSFNLETSDIELISDLINTHMGPYTISKYSNIVLDTPTTSLQKLLFNADFLASRKENDVVKDMLKFS